MTTFHCLKWGSCNCPTGTVSADCPGLLDRRNVHVFEGEHLRLERLAANRGCVFTPWESLLAVAVMLAAIGAVVVML